MSLSDLSGEGGGDNISGISSASYLKRKTTMAALKKKPFKNKTKNKQNKAKQKLIGDLTLYPSLQSSGEKRPSGGLTKN